MPGDIVPGNDRIDGIFLPVESFLFFKAQDMYLIALAGKPGQVGQYLALPQRICDTIVRYIQDLLHFFRNRR